MQQLARPHGKHNLGTAQQNGRFGRLPQSSSTWTRAGSVWFVDLTRGPLVSLQAFSLCLTMHIGHRRLQRIQVLWADRLYASVQPGHEEHDMGSSYPATRLAGYPRHEDLHSLPRISQAHAHNPALGWLILAGLDCLSGHIALRRLKNRLGRLRRLPTSAAPPRFHSGWGPRQEPRTKERNGSGGCGGS
jgi:hypothetical protein